MYKSPSIEIFENVRQPRAVPTTGSGFATVGFSTNGPVNKLMAFNSVSDFEKYMGKAPVSNFTFTHNMINRAMSGNAGGTLYFMRVGDFGVEDGKASVGVSNYSGGAPYELSIASTDVSDNYVKKHWFVARSEEPFTGILDASVSVSFTLNESSEPLTEVFDLEEVGALDIFNTGGDASVYAVDMNKIVRRLNKNSKFSSLATASLVKDGNVYILKITSKFVGVDYSLKDFSLTTTLEDSSNEPVNLLFDILGNDYDPTTGITGTDVVAQTGFKIVAKNPGSAMNGFTIRKENNSLPVGETDENKRTFNVTIYSARAKSSLLETFSNLTLENFVERINDNFYGSEFIEIDGYVSGVAFKEGTYILSEGEVLSDGTTVSVVTENTVVGKDGVPESELGDNTEEITTLFLGALRDPSFLNKDTVNFSILATPELGNTEVQEAAIELVEARGDAVYLVDSPLDYMEEGKRGVKMSVDWSNGAKDRATPITSSYALMYYGWLQVPDLYGSSNIIAPPSLLVLPKMLSVDKMYGLPCFSPAGVTRGKLIASDYFYSPDIEDRELMCGEGNSLNPIIFSNTRGLMIFSQKTADRSNSAINRIHVRRMLNDIKRRLYSSLDVMRFEVNNTSTQSETRRIVENILSIYRSAEVLQSYSVRVSSPGGAEADVLNITISMVPYGLVERIRIFLNIDEAGATITEG